MRIEEDLKLDFSNVLIKPKRSTLKSRKDVDLSRTFKFKYSKLEWKGTPVIASNMDTTGTFEMARVFSRNHMMTCIHKYYELDRWTKEVPNLDFNFVCPSIGANQKDLEKFNELYYKIAQGRIKFISLDVANGYQEYFSDFVKRFRDAYPFLTIIAGNVVTDEMTEQLIISGADIVRVGLGSGSACTTRLQTGVGYPQLSSIIECSDVSHGLGGQIISDGGCTCPGDIAKAFCAGADWVMLGGMLAGHDESGGELISEWHESDLIIRDLDGASLGKLEVEKKFKKFYGMSSETANKKYSGGLKDYRSAEGKEVKIEYRGPIEKTIQNILGGLRSTATYIGSPNLKSFSKCASFVKVNQQVNEVFNV